VCKSSDFAKKVTYQTMSPADFLTLKKTVEAEAPVYPAALHMARLEWKSNEEAEVRSTAQPASSGTNKIKKVVSKPKTETPFPEELVAKRSCEACGTFTSAKAAQTELASLEKADKKAENEWLQSQLPAMPGSGGGTRRVWNGHQWVNEPVAGGGNADAEQKALDNKKKELEDLAQKGAALIQKYVTQLLATQTAPKTSK